MAACIVGYDFDRASIVREIALALPTRRRQFPARNQIAMPHPDYRPRRKRSRSWLGRLLLWSGVTVLVVGLALVIAAPWLVRAAVPEAFARLGLEASASGGRFNPLRAEITVEGFVLGPAAQPALSLDELGIGVSVRALISGRLELKRLRVKGVDADTDRLMSLWKRVGADSGTGPGTGSGGLPIALDRVELVDVRMTSVGERIGHDVRIARLEIDDPTAFVANGKSHVELQGTVGKGSVELNLELTSDADTLNGGGDYRLDGVPLHGWAALGAGGADPLTAGTVSGRGELHVSFGSKDEALRLSLDGPIRVGDLGLDVTPIDAERGDASWNGRLGLEWSPAMSSPGVRGNGTLEVKSVQITSAQAQRAPIRADLADLSWHGDFDWRDVFATKAKIAGTRLEVRDASGAKPRWQGRADNFSWRMRTRPGRDAGTLDVAVDDFGLSRLRASIGGDDASVDVDIVKVAVDSLATTRSRAITLGVVSADSMAVTAPSGAGSGRRQSIELQGFTAGDMTVDVDGALRAANAKADSGKYADTRADRTVRVEGIDLAGIGLGAAGVMGVDRLQVASARAKEPGVDVWVSEVEVVQLHGNRERIGAGRVSVARMFQSPTDGISWQISALAVDGIDGGLDGATRIAKIELPSMSLGIADASWEAKNLHAAGLALTHAGTVNAARLGVDSLERHQASSGDLRIAKLEATGLGLEGPKAVAGAVSSHSIEYHWPNGLEIATKGVKVNGLSGDRSSGVTVERLTVARGSGRAIDGMHLAGDKLEGRGLTLDAEGAMSLRAASLARISGALPGSMSLEIEGTEAASIARTSVGALSTRTASVENARLVQKDGATWTLSKLAANTLAWQSARGVGIDDATLESIEQTRGKTRLLLAKSLQVKNLELVSPSDVAIASATTGLLEGGSGTLAWKVDTIDAEGFVRRPGAGEKLDRLGVAKVEVDDAQNSAHVVVENAGARSLQISELEEFAAASLSVGAVRIASGKPDWPSRFSLAGAHVEKASLRSGNSIDVQEVIARQPYLIVAQASDNTWMWPPLPGGDRSRGDRSEHAAELHIERFSTRGPGRVVYIDRRTQPIFQLALDPVVVAMENLDTRLPGSKARFRVRGIGSRLSDIGVSGALTRRVDAFDLALEVDARGVFLPDFNPYVTRREPVVVSDGWADVSGNIGVENHRLDGKVNLLLSGLEVRFKDDVSLFSRIDAEDFPVRTALALLKDAKGDIRIDVPLQAQTARKEFDFIDTFQNAFAGTVTAAGKIAGDLPEKTFDRALSLLEDTASLLPGVDAERYPPIVFAPGSAAISAEPRVYLGQLAERMQSHSALELALCGRAAPEDTKALAKSKKRSSIEELFEEASKGTFHAYAADQSGLLSLAGARAGAVRRHLRDLHGVSNQRLAECESEVGTTSDGNPSVGLRVKTPARARGLFDFL